MFPLCDKKILESLHVSLFNFFNSIQFNNQFPMPDVKFKTLILTNFEGGSSTRTILQPAN